VARAVLNDQVHWIAPSRFGYLRSTFHEGATFDEQAHAYAYLLDRLGIDRVAVVALSHGGPSALLLAALHPDRVSSLTLISAGVASSSDASQQQANRQGAALTWVFQRDYRYWAITTAFRQRFLGIMGVSDDVIDRLTPEQQRLAGEVITFMNPVSLRAAGVRFDNQAALPNQRIATIQAPTLIVHARDDTLQQYRNAEFAAATIPGARLVGFDRGGHLLLAVEQEAIRSLVGTHIIGFDILARRGTLIGEMFCRAVDPGRRRSTVGDGRWSPDERSHHALPDPALRRRSPGNRARHRRVRRRDGGLHAVRGGRRSGDPRG
jgi:pimeloyl-ACP methyl ester carboxylesterase